MNVFLEIEIFCDYLANFIKSKKEGLDRYNLNALSLPYQLPSDPKTSSIDGAYPKCFS